MPVHIDDLARLYADEHRFDDAIATKYRAIAAGLRGEPDPLADVAEWLIASGRRGEGDALYAKLRAAAPDDVWVYNVAVFAYRGVDDAEALRWALDRIDVAFGTGDAEQIITQLAGFARGAWDALGQAHDTALLERVDAFVAAWTRPKRLPHVYEPSPPVQACAHCDFDPAAAPPSRQCHFRPWTSIRRCYAAPLQRPSRPRVRRSCQRRSRGFRPPRIGRTRAGPGRTSRRNLGRITGLTRIGSSRR